VIPHDTWVVVKGGGDLGTGVAVRLRRCGFGVIVTEIPAPTVIRRTVAFAEAVYAGRQVVEGIEARRVGAAADVPETLRRGVVPVLVDPDAHVARSLGPDILVDATVSKRNVGTRITDAPIVIGLGPGLKVGVAWRGGTPRTGQQHRSVGLGEWGAALRLPGVHFVSLQYGEHENEIARARAKFGVDIHHWPHAIADYDETAALVCALDLVITVTTSVAHLAGALGQQVWILANAAPRWCYLATGSATPWYRSARIVRQSRPGDWNEVMTGVANALAAAGRKEIGDDVAR